jgi:hypothetical protein
MNEASMKDGSGAAGMLASREQYWEEANADAKIERLRDEVASLCRIAITQAGTIRQLLAHQHSGNGALVAPIPDPNMNRSLGSPDYGVFAADNGIPHSIRNKYERGERG